MPFEPSAEGPSTPLRIAIVGAGIAGLGAAHLLADSHRVTLFEGKKRLGGHARTVLAGRQAQVAVDTGFIVFNPVNYPRLCALFEALAVPTKPSDMSFSAGIDSGRVEYATESLASLFAQQKNALDTAFLAMILDILRFNQLARYPAHDRDLTLGEWLDAHRFGRAFRDNYLLVFAGAIWSATPGDMLAFPAATLLQFFRNHRLLSLRERVQWRTVDGGSIEYVRRLETSLRRKGVTIKAGAPVRRVAREPHVLVEAEGQEPERFDAIVFACHSDQTLAMLADPSADERATLGALRYTSARAVLHDDPRQMPLRRICWSSWNARRAGANASVTYWMNRLQGLPAAVPLFVTLNPLEPIPEAAIFDEAEVAHPIFDRAAIAAQARLPALQGVRNSYFCGAYAHFGFHEDGLKSAADAVSALVLAK